MDRGNHYEASFEAYLRWHGLCYVAVDEAKRACLDGVRVKSLDFLVYGKDESRLVVDVKGRRFPAGKRKRRVWECWSTRDDIDGLERWAELAGAGYQGLLVFNYHLQAGIDVPDDTADLWTWRGRRYLLRAVRVEDYRRHMRVRSPKWDTVHVPQAIFRELVRPVYDFTHVAQAPEVPLEP